MLWEKLRKKVISEELVESRVIIRGFKVWALTYMDDVVLVARTSGEIREIMATVKDFLEK